MSGLTRVRSLTQDDCHVFAMPSQIEGEINLMLDMVDDTYRTFGFKDFWVRVSTHDPNDKEKYIGSMTVWEASEAALKRLITGRGWKFDVGVGEAAFYGPKLDFMAKDVIGREWQLSTIQLDMNLPERFELEYVDADGSKQRPVVIHRAILGSTERFLGILIEHYGGAFPVWPAPVPVLALSVADRHADFARALVQELSYSAIRAEADASNETVGTKIRNAEAKTVPYALVVGDKRRAGRAHGPPPRERSSSRWRKRRSWSRCRKKFGNGRSEIVYSICMLYFVYQRDIRNTTYKLDVARGYSGLFLSFALVRSGLHADAVLAQFVLHFREHAQRRLQSFLGGIARLVFGLALRLFGLLHEGELTHVFFRAETQEFGCRIFRDVPIDERRIFHAATPRLFQTLGQPPLLLGCRDFSGLFERTVEKFLFGPRRFAVAAGGRALSDATRFKLAQFRRGAEFRERFFRTHRPPGKRRSEFAR